MTWRPSCASLCCFLQANPSWQSSLNTIAPCFSGLFSATLYFACSLSNNVLIFVILSTLRRYLVVHLWLTLIMLLCSGIWYALYFLLVSICVWRGWPISLPYHILECIAGCFPSITQEVLIPTPCFNLFYSSLFDDANRGKIRMTLFVFLRLWLSWLS